MFCQRNGASVFAGGYGNHTTFSKFLYQRTHVVVAVEIKLVKKLRTCSYQSLIDLEIANGHHIFVCGVSDLAVTIESNAEVVFVYAAVHVEPVKSNACQSFFRHFANNNPFFVDHHTKIVRNDLRTHARALALDLDCVGLLFRSLCDSLVGAFFNYSISSALTVRIDESVRVLTGNYNKSYLVIRQKSDFLICPSRSQSKHYRMRLARDRKAR